jgi:transcriptional regulator with XRE-family HTH domain
MTETPHHTGRKIKLIRTIKGIKQETLADMLGLSQGEVSQMEQSEEVKEDRLKKVAAALDMTTDAIKAFDENAPLHQINTFQESSNCNGINYNYNCTFNPIDKLLEVLDENKKLYERLLESEQK